jgi:predicted dehydrogenase
LYLQLAKYCSGKTKNIELNPFMKQNTIRIGVMGCANIAGRSVIPAIQQVPQLQLAAVASRTQQKADEFATRFGCKAVVGYDELLHEDIDAVYMPLPTGLHEEYIIKCLEAGKHVFAEKSLAMNGASAERMVALARQKGLVLMEDFMFEYHSQHRYLLNLLAEGVIGTIRNFRATFCFPPLPAGNFRYDMAVGGGGLLDAGAYTLKAAQLVIGGQLDLLGSAMFIDPNTDADIAGNAQLVSNGQVGIQLAWGFDHFYQCGYEILGTKGKITTNRSFTPAASFQPTLRMETPGDVQEMLLDADNHFVNILTAFAGFISTGNHEIPIAAVQQQAQLAEAVRSKSVRYAFNQ